MNNRDLIGKRFNILDKGFIELQDIMGDDLAIVNAARVSYLGESKGEVQDKKLLFYLMKHKHTSPFEMVEFKFHVKCPLVVARQWFRHRTWSFNEVSRRYTSENIEFYIPDTWRKQAVQNKQVSEDEVVSGNYSEDLKLQVSLAMELYNEMVSNGVAKEQARIFLPQAMYTEFIGKVDAHNLMNFLRLRMAKDVQYETRIYAQAIFEHFFKPALPWTAEAFEEYVLKE